MEESNGFTQFRQYCSTQKHILYHILPCVEWNISGTNSLYHKKKFIIAYSNVVAGCSGKQIRLHHFGIICERWCFVRIGSISDSLFLWKRQPSNHTAMNNNIFMQFSIFFGILWSICFFLNFSSLHSLCIVVSYTNLISILNGIRISFMKKENIDQLSMQHVLKTRMLNAVSNVINIE